MKTNLYYGVLFFLLASLSANAQLTTVTTSYYGGYDYQFSSRINRFHKSFTSFTYYAPVYTDVYWYNYQPYSYGLTIYGEDSGFGYSDFYFPSSVSRFYMGYTPIYSQPYVNIHSGWYSSYYFGPYYRTINVFNNYNYSGTDRPSRGFYQPASSGSTAVTRSSTESSRPVEPSVRERVSSSSGNRRYNDTGTSGNSNNGTNGAGNSGDNGNSGNNGNNGTSGNSGNNGNNGNPSNNGNTGNQGNNDNNGNRYWDDNNRNENSGNRYGNDNNPGTNNGNRGNPRSAQLPGIGNSDGNSQRTGTSQSVTPRRSMNSAANRTGRPSVQGNVTNQSPRSSSATTVKTTSPTTSKGSTVSSEKNQGTQTSPSRSRSSATSGRR